MLNSSGQDCLGVTQYYDNFIGKIGIASISQPEKIIQNCKIIFNTCIICAFFVFVLTNNKYFSRKTLLSFVLVSLSFYTDTKIGNFNCSKKLLFIGHPTNL